MSSHECIWKRHQWNQRLSSLQSRTDGRRSTLKISTRSGAKTLTEVFRCSSVKVTWSLSGRHWRLYRSRLVQERSLTLGTSLLIVSDSDGSGSRSTSSGVYRWMKRGTSSSVRRTTSVKCSSRAWRTSKGLRWSRARPSRSAVSWIFISQDSTERLENLTTTIQ